MNGRGAGERKRIEREGRGQRRAWSEHVAGARKNRRRATTTANPSRRPLQQSDLLASPGRFAGPPPPPCCRGSARGLSQAPRSQPRQIPRLALLSAPHVGQRTNTLLPSPFLIGNRFGSPPSHSAARTRGARTSSATLFSPANVPHRGNPSRQPVAPPPLPLTPPVRIRYSAPRLNNGRTIAIITRLRRRQRDLSAPSAPRRDFAAV